MLHLLSHFFGLDNLSGPFYGFWSGVGSDITELAIFVGAWHFLVCHEDGCIRLGHRTTVEPNGHHYRRCTKHHAVRHEAG